jgi:hypothetical protein
MIIYIYKLFIYIYINKNSLLKQIEMENSLFELFGREPPTNNNINSLFNFFVNKSSKYHDEFINNWGNL